MKDYELIEKEIGGNIHYYAKFTDGQGIEQTAELDSEVYSVRLRQYFDEKKTFEQIAIIDDSTKQAIHKSLVKALDILRAKKYF